MKQTVAQLKAEAKALKIPRYSKMRKAELIEVIAAHKEYDPADNSAKCYSVAIAAMREKLKGFRREIIGDCTLYLGDCREILPLLPKVDAVVTDPPYNSGIKYGPGTNDARDDYWEWLAERIGLMRRIATSVAVKHSALKISPFLLRFPESRVLVWSKPFSSGFPFKGYATHWEPIHLLQGAAIDWSKDVFECNAGAGNREATTGHPAQMPEALAMWLIKTLTPLAFGSVVDPFMGSGTTGVASVRLGRRFVGVEIDPVYFDIALRRIEEAYKQPDFFVPRPAPPVQLTLEAAE